MKDLYRKSDSPVDKIRKFLEPGPIVLVSSEWQGHTNIMTMGWHTVLDFSPSLVGCLISNGNFSYEMIKNSGECVINAVKVKAPMIKECYANYECKISDPRLIADYNFFIFEVVKAHVAESPKYPKTVHYR